MQGMPGMCLAWQIKGTGVQALHPNLHGSDELPDLGVVGRSRQSPGTSGSFQGGCPLLRAGPVIEPHKGFTGKPLARTQEGRPAD